MILYTPIYNEMPWTPFFLNHLLEYDCPIFIGEGASEVIYDKNPRSTDGSLELITRFAEKWKDRVTVINHDYSQRRKGASGKFRPRELVKMQVWNQAVNGEWIIGLSPDNFYSSEDIRKLKKIIQEVSREKEIYNILTNMKVFVFNFRTIITRPIIGLCGWWYNLWPFIYKKNPDYIMIPGDELLYEVANSTGRNRRGMIKDKFEIRDLQAKLKANNPHLYIAKEITNFHYKGLKFLYKYKHRQKKHIFEHIKSFPLVHEHLIEYEGSHPKVLDGHPWKKVVDCRKIKTAFNYKDFLYLIENEKNN